MVWVRSARSLCFINLKGCFMKELLLRVKELRIFDQTVTFDLSAGELWGVTGPNRSGKTTLGKALCGVTDQRLKGTIERLIATERMAFADYTADTFHFHYADFYYQQRYNQSDVAELEQIADYLSFDGQDSYRSELFDKLLPREILSEKMIELSSGETRKVLLLKTLFSDRDIYVLDNPLTGLDSASATVVADLLRSLVREHRKTVVVLMNDLTPELDLDGMVALEGGTENGIDASCEAASLFYQTGDAGFEVAFRVKDRELRAGHRTLLQGLSWEVRRGEKWLLRGANGSGKSTLMSLLNADNPMSYSMGIELFDRRRGTGESIWEIKSRVGFVSPEIQLYWNGQSSVKGVIQSGFTGTLYLNRRLTEEEMERYDRLLGVFGLRKIEETQFTTLSTGDKRMVAVARALVQNPPLLILDEPFQGLDHHRFEFLREFLNRCADEQRTLIQIAHTDREVLPCINRVASIAEKRLKTGD